jgi:predicted enzyme related to lactoylglutathione lyase
MFRKRIAVVGVSAALFASLGASSRTPVSSLPPAHAGEFVWHDLVTNDPAACRTFYGALFGWTFEPSGGIDPGYQIIRQAGLPIGGIVPLKDTSSAVVAQWLTYVVVPDVDRAVDAFRRGGGKVFRGPLTTKKDLRVAVVADPQGAPLGLVSRGPREANTPAPSLVPAPPPLNQWLWMEYVATNTTEALGFYAEAVGFKHEVSEARDNFTYYLLATDRPRAGLFRTPWTRETSAWLPYVRVADPAAVAARVVELGGRVALPPSPGVRQGSLAIVLDPTGAPFALQKYPFAAGVTP